MPRTLAALLASLAITLPLSAQTTAPTTEPAPSHITLITEANVPALKTATTLDDLKKIEPLTLGDCHYRLALQSDTVPFGEGILIYAYWDGKGTPPQNANIESEDEKLLGPFRITLTRKKLPNEIEKINLSSICRLTKSDPPAGDSLLLAPIIPPRPGTYELTLTDSEDNTFARTTILCPENKNPHAFYPLESRETKAAVRIGAPALPKWDDALLSKIPKALPTFIPAEDPTTLKATLENDRITLTAPSDTFTNVDDNLLVRIWINNQPLNAIKLQKRTEKLKNESVRIKKNLTFQISLDPADYSAKPGDSVDIQFLYTEQDYIDATRDEKTIHCGLASEKKDQGMYSFTPVRLSNRLHLLPKKE